MKWVQQQMMNRPTWWMRAGGGSFNQSVICSSCLICGKQDWYHGRCCRASVTQTCVLEYICICVIIWSRRQAYCKKSWDGKMPCFWWFCFFFGGESECKYFYRDGKLVSLFAGWIVFINIYLYIMEFLFYIFLFFFIFFHVFSYLYIFLL